MKIRKYLEESVELLTERRPFTKGKVTVELGSLSSRSNILETVPCIAVNETRFLTFKASYLFASPLLLKTLEKGGTCKGELAFSLRAQRENFTSDHVGTGMSVSYFMGMEKDRRSLDIFQRLFEDGYSLSNIQGIPLINSSKTIEITVTGRQKKGVGNKILDRNARLTVR